MALFCPSLLKHIAHNRQKLHFGWKNRNPPPHSIFFFASQACNKKINNNIQKFRLEKKPKQLFICLPFAVPLVRGFNCYLTQILHRSNVNFALYCFLHFVSWVYVCVHWAKEIDNDFAFTWTLKSQKIKIISVHCMLTNVLFSQQS